MGIHQVVRCLGIHYGPNVTAGTNQPRKGGMEVWRSIWLFLMIVAALTVLGINVVGVPWPFGERSMLPRRLSSGDWVIGEVVVTT